MFRSFEGSRTRETPIDVRTSRTISFALKHAGSDGFKALFREGTNLVEVSAAYLDGPGREEAKTMRRAAALAYATESMRLTTRLMQVASWLLLRRAVNEGELTPAQALSEKHRVRLARQEMACASEILTELPPVFVDLCVRSMRLQARVLHLDASIAAAIEPAQGASVSAVAMQWAKLHAAFSNSDAAA